MIWGKVFGAVLGAGLGMLLAWSPPLAALLALVGAVLGHLVADREPALPRSERPPSKEELLRGAAPPKRPAALPRAPLPRRASAEDKTLAEVLCPLFIEMARVDGPVSQLEVRVAREFFEQHLRFEEPAMEEVRLALKDALAAPVQEIEFLVTRARTSVKPGQRVEVVRALYDVGMADGSLQRSEQDMLKRIVSLFNLSDEQLQQITAQFFGTGDSSYSVLGVTPEASDDEVKAAYRRLAAEHHPDKAQDGGERFREVKEAYETIKRLRGT